MVSRNAACDKMGEVGHNLPVMDVSSIEAWLAAFIQESGGVAGTVHRREGEFLEIVASVNIPPPVIEATRRVPKGKGMAGLAFSRNIPVDTCNLKTDESGDVRPGAKAVNANAAVALPVHDSEGGVRAVVGVAWMGERELTQEEVKRLSERAEELPS